MLIYQFYQPTAAFGGVPAYPVNAGGVAAPDVTGTTPESGDTLTCTDGIWTGAPTITFTYQWCQAVVDETDEVVTDIHGNPIGVEIDGETSSTYEADVSDVGERIFCIVTGHNDYGTGVGYSNVVGPVVAGVPTGPLIASVTEHTFDGGGNGFTSSAIDTTGATLLIVTGTSLVGAGVTVTDSKSNTWTPIAAYANTTVLSRILYCVPTSVGSGHTVTVTCTGAYPAMTFAAFSGTHATPYGGEVDGSTGTSVTASAATGVTPSFASLMIAHVAVNGVGVSMNAISGGFTMLTDMPHTATSLGHRMAYLIQPALTLTKPNWTIASSSEWATSVAAFRNI